MVTLDFFNGIVAIFLIMYIPTTIVIIQLIKSKIQVISVEEVQNGSQNSIIYKYEAPVDKLIYNIEFKNIIMVEKEMDSKRCMIHAEDGDYPIQGSLNEVLERLDKRFFKCNRAVAVNVEQIQSYNFTKNVVIFKNGEEFKETSRSKKREMFNHVRGVR